jgi:hypothetical protein
MKDHTNTTLQHTRACRFNLWRSVPVELSSTNGISPHPLLVLRGTIYVMILQVIVIAWASTIHRQGLHHNCELIISLSHSQSDGAYITSHLRFCMHKHYPFNNMEYTSRNVVNKCYARMRLWWWIGMWFIPILGCAVTKKLQCIDHNNIIIVLFIVYHWLWIFLASITGLALHAYHYAYHMVKW